MLESIAGPRPIFAPESVFVYMNDPFFDMTISEDLRLINSTEIKLHCLLKAKSTGRSGKKSCERDYFAFNYATAKFLREEMLLLDEST